MNRKAKEEREALETSKNQIAFIVQAQEIAQQVSQQVQEIAHKQVAAIVTRCLEAVFGEDAYEFRIVFERKRSKTEARLVFFRDGHEIDPQDAAGGGVLDLAGFALRLSSLMLTRPERRRLLVMDEGFKFLSADYVPLVRELLETLAEELGLQFLIVTHAEGLKAGKVIRLT